MCLLVAQEVRAVNCIAFTWKYTVSVYCIDLPWSQISWGLCLNFETVKPLRDTDILSLRITVKNVTSNSTEGITAFQHFVLFCKRFKIHCISTESKRIQACSDSQGNLMALVLNQSYTNAQVINVNSSV